ncbi:MAG: undecaprenyldiphospho-muramoylpentapeptide beta-N-acetylglucosaminyltransferase [Candidatus Tagabacteria bacterium RIFCSPLOWO2_01_FULL_39_11]|uniref:UDP-N-acetylglucosamine--N-acetylmuramyl-(pentapeptide) pyrophosphoryl-undecaprenol N-acetylglucosamine transferase n=1 Tax=Candidatus Tagabacteria bacterium RIFCSPLOWO2_01_FULL_39_11 TaxID=1802295 RepID=A0A1G2LSG8_9BACT|nr:MAG: undecaprenyldiphospho-muramoylpentapeptide beta-N-acetylglucosaminyltransferase [Candidatus Tagabacteria bacterium RIFCSPLOWO2_01_FULL_39_11]
MKILFTGGGTGGHFYPTIAVIRALKKIADEERIFDLRIFFMSDSPYDDNILLEEGVEFIKIPAGKIRRYFSLLNIPDIIKTFFGVIKAVWKIYIHIPDAIFIKGGYASFPAFIAAVLFRIPILVHESDAVPGRVNRWAGRFAKRIAVSFAGTIKYFPEEKTAFTGNPIRINLIGGTHEEARTIFKLEEEAPIIFVLGGSQGAQKINTILSDALLSLIKDYQIIHQCGKANIKEVSGRSSVILENSESKRRYHVFPFLTEAEMRNASFAADLIVSRAGAGAIFEIAAWGKPSIIIPLPSAAQDHQRENTYIYKRAGACEVIEEENLSATILISEINGILKNFEKRERMKKAALNFAKPDAASKIAKEIINLALEHA